MKLFSKAEMQALEKSAADGGVSMEALMEAAGKALFGECLKRLEGRAERKVVLLCGSGNNGGDGFVAARLLYESGADCRVILCCGEPKTALAGNARSKIPGGVKILDGESNADEAAAEIDSAGIIADCIFGFGFKGELRGTAERLVLLANKAKAFKISADLPSGAECDSAAVSSVTFRADCTVSFTAFKPAHFSYPAKEYCGEPLLAQVGVERELTDSAVCACGLTEKDEVMKLFPRRNKQSNKGDFGRLLLVCGSYGMAGACIMAARAALRCGVGLLNIAVDRSIYPIVAPAVPEAVFTVMDAENPAETEAVLCKALKACTACVTGCGLGKTAELLCPVVMRHAASPLVMDADALNYLAKNPRERSGIAPGVPLLLTPHPGEMSRLMGVTIASVQSNRISTALEAAKSFNAITVLKGAATVTASPNGKTRLNPTGNPGMAKGGSGDVLAGMLGAILAQGSDPFEAAAAAVYLHGLCGDMCVSKLGEYSMQPTDIINCLPEIFNPPKPFFEPHR